MSADSETSGLDGLHRSRRPQYENKFNLGQVGQIVSVLLSIGGVVLYQRGETEAIRKDAAVQSVKIDTINRDAAAQKEDQRAQVQAQKEVLAEIKSDVKNIGSNVQTLANQVQQLSFQQGQTRRP